MSATTSRTHVGIRSAAALVAACGIAMSAPTVWASTTWTDTPKAAPNSTDETEKVLNSLTISGDAGERPAVDHAELALSAAATDPPASGLTALLNYQSLFDAIGAAAVPQTRKPTNYRGEVPSAAPVRYFQDFEWSSSSIPEWEGMRSRYIDGHSRIAGPFRNAEIAVSVETKPGVAYMVRFDLALVGARIGSESASDTFSVRVDGEEVLTRPFHEYTALAMELERGPEDGLTYPKVQLFFTAEHEYTEIAFVSTAAGDPGGEMWGIDNVVIDRVPNNPAAFDEDGPSGPAPGGGFGGGGPSGLPPIRGLDLGGGGGGGSSGGGGGGGGGNPPGDPPRFPDLEPPPGDPPPAPPQPPVPDRPELDPPPPGNPPGDDPPPVPTPGTGLVLALGGLMAGGRRRRAE